MAKPGRVGYSKGRKMYKGNQVRGGQTVAGKETRRIARAEKQGSQRTREGNNEDGDDENKQNRLKGKRSGPLNRNSRIDKKVRSRQGEWDGDGEKWRRMRMAGRFSGRRHFTTGWPVRRPPLVGLCWCGVPTARNAASGTAASPLIRPSPRYPAPSLVSPMSLSVPPVNPIFFFFITLDSS